MFAQTHISRRYYPQSDAPPSSSSRPSTAKDNDSVDDTVGSLPAAKSPTSPQRPRTTSSAISETVSNLSDLSFNPFNLSRANSIYTLGRTSFAAQLNQLICIDLPDPEALSASISAIPTASEACKVLASAAPQIKRWIDTAAQILSGLDTEDDIELVSSGDESVQEVDTAVTRFAELINIYIGAIDGLQKRSDVSSVPGGQVKDVVNTLEAILGPWGQVQTSLADAKSHVSLAKEWEDLWNTYMGEIRSELDDLERLIFQLEEKRHTSSTEKPQEDAVFEMDDRDLTPIAEEGGRLGSRDASPSGVVPSFTISSPLIAASAPNASEDSGLLALFARMQPVQASLSFLPIRLTSFTKRAANLFPTACEELEDRRNDLEGRWQKIEKAAETLRDELSEDRWIDVFRNAGRQATKMCQSVDRGIKKLNEAILTTSNQGTPASTLAKKISDYENKRISFGPAIQKILAVIDKGVSERKTVNGEVLKIQAETRRVWDALQAEMKDMDTTISKLPESNSKHLREGVSAIVTKDLDKLITPSSSPDSPTDHVTHSARHGSTPSTPDVAASTGSLRSTSSSVPAGRRPMGLPISSRYLSPRSVSGSSTASTPRTSFSSVTPRTGARPGGLQITPASAPPASNKPRWSGSTVVDYKQYGPHKRPGGRLYRGTNSAASSVYSYSSSLPHSPLSREQTSSPSPATRRLSSSPARTATTQASNSTAGPPEARPRQYKPSHLVQEKLGMVSKPGEAAPSGRASAAGSRTGSRAGSRIGSRLGMRTNLPVKTSKDSDNKPKWRA